MTYLTLNAIAKNPRLYRYSIDTVLGKMTLRPLEPTDEQNLTRFIDCLSSQTKQFYSYSQPGRQIAGEMCSAINKYDKLRLVLENESSKELVGLFEFSFDIPKGDVLRFQTYNINLSFRDCRIGPLLKDEYQSKGIGSQVLPKMIAIAKQFNRNRIILWGGVRQENAQAVRFYEKNGFKRVGSFRNRGKIARYDMLLEIERDSVLF